MKRFGDGLSSTTLPWRLVRRLGQLQRPEENALTSCFRIFSPVCQWYSTSIGRYILPSLAMRSLSRFHPASKSKGPMAPRLNPVLMLSEWSFPVVLQAATLSLQLFVYTQEHSVQAAHLMGYPTLRLSTLNHTNSSQGTLSG